MQEIYLKHSLQVFLRMDMLILKHILDCDHLSYIAKLDDDTPKKKKKKAPEENGVSRCEDG